MILSDKTIVKMLENNTLKISPLEKEPLGMVYFGHGSYQEPGCCRYNEKAVYWQKYDPDRKHRTKDKPMMGHY